MLFQAVHSKEKLEAVQALDTGPRWRGEQKEATIKYFTAETDPKGADYQGGRDEDALVQFVSETLEVKCLLADTAGCSEKETEFMGKWKAKPKEEVKSQLERLTKMQGGSMAPDLKKWVAQRVNILKQLSEA